MSLEEAERAVDATVLWHLRILAGWGPALSATSLRLLAGRFEIENIEDLVLRLSGTSVRHPFELGALSLGWSRIATARSPGEVRERLARSFWRDPGGQDLGTVRVWLRLVWASHVADQLPFLRPLATGAARLVVARAEAAGVVLETRPLDLAHALLGPDLSIAAFQVPGLTESGLNESGAWGKAPRGEDSSDRLWAAEIAWRSEVESTGLSLAAASHPSESMVVGVVLLLGVDAWRVRGALQSAASKNAPGEMIDAPA